MIDFIYTGNFSGLSEADIMFSVPDWYHETSWL